jgi:DNA segregation ATPase FtsK/SpoIIIE, S-DNA-T family
MSAQKKSISRDESKRQDTGTNSIGGINKSFDRVANIWLQFTRYGRDFIGIILVASGLITLFGLAGFSRGLLIVYWSRFLASAVGWAKWIVPPLIIGMGLVIFLRHLELFKKLSFRKILSIEVLFFLGVMILATVGGKNLDRAEAGQDGGVIGWGLVTLLEFIIPYPWSFILLLIIGAALVGTLSGRMPILFRSLEVWLEEELKTVGLLDRNGKPSDVALNGLVQSGKAPATQNSPDSITAIPRNDRLPPLNLLMQEHSDNPDEDDIHATADLIEQTLLEFGIPARVVGFRVGPTVTQFAIEPGFTEKMGPDGQLIQQKVRVAQISALSRDLALALSAERLRVEAPVPGHTFVGIEVPNQHLSLVRLRGLIESDAFQNLGSPMAIALGRNVSGQPLVADLAKMPHLLIAGTTGSGKSVAIAAIAIGLVMNNTPEELRLAMLDPKMVELIRFNGLPHLFGKVETEQERMLAVLRWALVEMDSRYRLLESTHSRDLESYNRKVQKRKQPTLPRIAILIDELADLMMQAPDQTESSLVRLAQMARATGIHLVVATQRPSTDVVTGLIKANFPARLSFTVASSIDSRVILDTTGAETLLGRGDLLFLDPEVGSPQRAQGVIVTDHEIERVIHYWQKMAPLGEALEPPWAEMVSEATGEGDDQLLKQAIDVVRSSQRASASLIQRRLRIGYPRAARLIDDMEALGVVGPAQGAGREREVLWSPDDVDLGAETDLDEE